MMLLFFVAKYGLEIHIELPPRYKIKIRVHEMMAFALKTEPYYCDFAVGTHHNVRRCCSLHQYYRQGTEASLDIP
jgi:hypothetical protein